MKISPGAALLALTRDPLSLLNLMFFSQASLKWGGGAFSYCVLPFLLLGYFSQVLKGAILADQAQLPQSRDVPSAMGLGCMGTFFIGSVCFFASMAALTCDIPLENLTEPKFPYLLGAVVPLWFVAAVWSSMIHAQYSSLRDVDKGNRMVSALPRIFFRPPLSLDGLLMLALFVAVSASLRLSGGGLGPAIPLCFLLSHCLGQYLRKVLGFQLG